MAEKASKFKICIPAKSQYAKQANSLAEATKSKLGPDAMELFEIAFLRPGAQNQKTLLAISKQYHTDEPLLLVNWNDGTEEAFIPNEESAPDALLSRLSEKLKELNIEIPKAKIDQSRPIQGSPPKNPMFVSTTAQPKPIQEPPKQQSFPDPKTPPQPISHQIVIETPPRPIPTQDSIQADDDGWTEAPSPTAIAHFKTRDPAQPHSTSPIIVGTLDPAQQTVPTNVILQRLTQNQAQPKSPPIANNLSPPKETSPAKNLSPIPAARSNAPSSNPSNEGYFSLAKSIAYSGYSAVSNPFSYLMGSTSGTPNRIKIPDTIVYDVTWNPWKVKPGLRCLYFGKDQFSRIDPNKPPDEQIRKRYSYRDIQLVVIHPEREGDIHPIYFSI